MSNPISDIVGGLVGLTTGTNAGPRRTVRLGAQGVLAGYENTAPLSLALNQVYQPAYLGLGGTNLEQLLFGGKTGSTQTVRWGPTTSGQGKYQNVISTPGGDSPGLLELIGRTAPELQRLYQEGAERGVESNLDLLTRSLPAARALLDTANPDLAALRSGLLKTASTNLNLGGRLAPEDLARITSGVRGDWASRGLGRSAPAQLAEALGIFGGGEVLRDRRITQSGNLYNILNASEPDYARFILGLGGNPVGNALQLLGGQQPLAYRGNQYDPFNPGGVGLANTGAQLSEQYNQRIAQNAGQVGGGIFDLITSIAGGFGGMGGGMFGGGAGGAGLRAQAGSTGGFGFY